MGGRGRPICARSICARWVLLAAGLTTVLVVATACSGSDDHARSTDRARPLVSVPNPTTSPPTTTTSSPATVPPTAVPPTTGPPPDAAPPTVPPTAPPPPATPTSIQSAIAALPVAAEGPRAGYDRSSFRYGVDDDHDRCYTRCEILAGQRYASLPGLPTGGWLSSYDGYSTPNPDEIEIDHVVPLAEAWDSGVGGWDAARRREFANDPLELLAVSRATNRSKSDDDPAEWQPPNRASWCQYAGLWTLVKLKYGLTADPAEVQALTNMAAGCP